MPAPIASKVIHWNEKVIRMTALVVTEDVEGSFNVSNDDQGSQPDDLSMSVSMPGKNKTLPNHKKTSWNVNHVHISWHVLQLIMSC